MISVEKAAELMQNGRLLDVYILARYAYREGRPFLPDSTYDTIHSTLVGKGILTEYTSRVYDDDPIPVTLLDSLGLSPIIRSEADPNSEEYMKLTADESTSIKPVTEFTVLHEYMLGNKDKKMVLSVKVNGIYLRNLLRPNEVALTLSRGRNEGIPWEATTQMSYVLQDILPKITGEIRVNGEGFVATEALEILSYYYDGNKPEHDRRFKNEKSSAVTMFRKKMRREHYKYCKFLAFSADGLSDTVSGTFEELIRLGFDVVPYMILEPNLVPENFENFMDWILPILDKMREMQGNIPADGVVLEIDEKGVSSEVKGQYMSRNIAIKLEHWSNEIGTGIVTDIIEEQQAVRCSYVVVIEPVVTSDKTTARRINAFNPSILFKEGINIGSRVHFERSSGAVNVLIHSGRNVSETSKLNSF